MCRSLRCLIKIEKKCGFIKTGEEFEQTKLVFKEKNKRFKVVGEVGGRK
jgi:hypothetical protein